MYNLFMKEKKVVFISDKNQRLFALTNAFMIFSQTKSTIFIYIVFVDLTKEEKREVERIVANLKMTNLKLIYKLSSEMELGISKLAHVPNITNVRLYLSSILKDTKNVLYLDNDVVIDGDLNEVFENLDYSKSYGRPWNMKNSWISKLRKEGLLKNNLYVNAGVLFLNLESWRKTNLEKALINFLIDKGEFIKFADQDTLNCNIEFSGLPYTWNLARKNWGKTNKQIAKKSNLKIYHFLSTLKQWDGDINLKTVNTNGRGNLLKKELKKMVRPQKEWKLYYKEISILTSKTGGDHIE